MFALRAKVDFKELTSGSKNRAQRFSSHKKLLLCIDLVAMAEESLLMDKVSEKSEKPDEVCGSVLPYIR